MRSAQRGSMLVLGIGMLLTLTSFAVLAVDIGRIFIVRNELQNVADASALAGANCLTRKSDPASAVNCLPALFNGLNWDRAIAKAQDQLSHNTAAQVPISSTDGGHQIQVGYWNINTHAWSGGGPNKFFAPITADDKPAIRVYVRKDDGVNNGPIAMLTRLMFGVGPDRPMWAQSVAVISSPSSVLPGNLIPQAINKCMFDKYWDSSTNSPRLADQTTLTYTKNGASLTIPQTIGQPWELLIGSAYSYGTCESGQWTTFANSDVKSEQEVRTLVDNGNPTPLNIGDTTYLKPGADAAGYNDIVSKYQSFIPSPPGPGVDVTVVVVDYSASSYDPSLKVTGAEFGRPVVGFAGFHIDDVKGGASKYIKGHFIPTEITSGGSGIGPFFGTYQPPRLGG